MALAAIQVDAGSGAEWAIHRPLSLRKPDQSVRFWLVAAKFSVSARVFAVTILKPKQQKRGYLSVTP
ncbi:MAG: hypothetical protein VR73_02780 [Gammaproteobacteria bacterium BRH_c0]|nr:MAG: hypothetical protein VR73_02780 [Gammaproteobacteria bacterium BRH_c0]